VEPRQSTLSPEEETNVAEDIQSELDAMKTLVETLEPLKPEIRTRVIDYVFNVLGIAKANPVASPALPTLALPTPTPTPQPAQPLAMPLGIHHPVDILSLKEQKIPTTATQMVAIVAYYLAHLASERQDSITKDDIQKYFVQGKFPLPASTAMALVDAKNAGYLDAVGPGTYRLNSVGYNLVAHKMPKNGATAPSKKTAKKSAKKSKK
jgi:hypothetical protein